MTVSEFEQQYGHLKPNHEYWYGEAVAKAGADWPHGLLQNIMAGALDEAGYVSAVEVTLKISAEVQPVPDIIAVSGRLELPYPTKAVDVVVEIISPEDSFHRVMRKCTLYGSWGIPTIVLLEPYERVGWLWDRQMQTPKPTDTIPLPNGKSIPLARIFAELDKILSRRAG